MNALGVDLEGIQEIDCRPLEPGKGTYRVNHALTGVAIDHRPFGNPAKLIHHSPEELFNVSSQFIH